MPPGFAISNDEDSRLLAAIVRQAQEAVFAIDRDGGVIFWNAGAERLLGIPASDAVGSTLDTTLLCDPADAFSSAVQRILDGAPSVRLESTCRRSDGSSIVAELSLSPVLDDDRLAAVSIIAHDVTSRQKSEKRLALQSAVTEILSTRPTLEEAACDLLEALCRSLGWDSGILWRVDSQTGKLRLLEIWIEEGVEIGRFADISRSMTFAEGEGLPGAVWEGRRPIAIADLAADSIYPRAEHAERDGLHGVISFPVMIADEVLGVMELFTRDVRVADQETMQLIELAGGQIAQILQRHRAQDALGESEARYRMLAATASDAIITIDIDSMVHFANDAVERIFGYTPGEMVGQDINRIIPEYLRLLHRKGMERYERTGEKHISWNGLSLPGLHKDGHEVPVELSFGEYRADGRHLFTAIIRDVTERSNAEQRLRSSEELNRIILSSLPAHIAVIDRHGTITAVNEAWERFGSQNDLRLADSSIGTNYLQICDSSDGECRDDARKASEGIRAVLKEEIPLFSLEYPCHSPDELRWFQLLATPMPLHIGGAVIAHINITDRKVADLERAGLLEREQTARSHAENAQRRFAFLAEASAVLSSSLDYQTTLSSVAWLAVPQIADWCAVDMLGADGEVDRLAVAHVDPEKIKWAYELQERYPIDMNAPTGLPNVLRTGVSEFYPDIPDEMLVAVIKDPEQLEITRQIGFTSVMIVPIIVRDRPAGAITFVSAESGRHYDSNDLALGEDIARRAATAIENAILYREVREQREWLHVTLSSIGDAVIATDQSGQITFMNHVAAELTGWRSKDAEGESLESVFHVINESTGIEVENPVLRVLREGATVGLANHTVLIARDGRRTPIDDSAAPIRDHMGKIIGVVMVFHDITDRRKAERERTELMEQVERTGERLTNIMATIPGVVWETWGEPDAENQKTDFISDYVETMLGYTAEEWLATPRFWYQITHPDDQERVEQGAAERYRSGGDGVSQFRWIRKDGRVIWVESRSTITRDDEGRPIGLRGVSMDITDRKEREIELRAAKEEAESANQAKDQFLAVLSHELRTPLTPVLAITQVLETSDELPEDLRPVIEMVRRNVELEARLIDDLLDLTKISKGKLQLNMENVDIHAHLNNVVEMCQSEIRGKELAITVDLQATRFHSFADPARIQQVFWNLIKNGVKFTPRGGKISIRSINPTPGELRIEVTDTGIGIDPELAPKIFEAFEQGGQTITKQFGGLGLGLSISRALVEMHGGRLSVTSEGIGEGAMFVLELSVVEPPGSGTTRGAAAGELAGTRIGRILLVDDHVETSTVLKLLLERRGYTVDTAHTVADALALAHMIEFDLLISDIGLPDGSGLDLMRSIRKEKPLPGIALSGFGMEEDIERSREAGFSEHLTKPVGFQRLQDAIARVLG